jgi:hypothetical protein
MKYPIANKLLEEGYIKHGNTYFKNNISINLMAGFIQSATNNIIYKIELGNSYIYSDETLKRLDAINDAITFLYKSKEIFETERGSL